MSNPLMPGDPMTAVHKQQLREAILQKLSPQGERPIVQYSVSIEPGIEAAIDRLTNTRISADAALKALCDQTSKMEAVLGKLEASSQRMLKAQEEKLQDTQHRLDAASNVLDFILHKWSTKAAELGEKSTMAAASLQSAPSALAKSDGNALLQTPETRTPPSAPPPARNRWAFLKQPIHPNSAIEGLLAIVVGIALAMVLALMSNPSGTEAMDQATKDSAASESEQAAEFQPDSLEDCAQTAADVDSSCERLADDFDKAFSAEKHCKNSDGESAIFCKLAKSLPEADDKARHDGYRYSALCDVVAQNVAEACKRGIYRIEKRMREADTGGDGGNGAE